MTFIFFQCFHKDLEKIQLSLQMLKQNLSSINYPPLLIKVANFELKKSNWRQLFLVPGFREDLLLLSILKSLPTNLTCCPFLVL